MTFYGMDTAQAEAFAETLAERRNHLDEMSSRLDSAVRGLSSAWQGPDYEQFRDEWDATAGASFSALLEALMRFARDLHEQAEDQNLASATSGLGTVAAWLDDIGGDIFQGGGFSLRNMFPNPNDIEDWVGMGLSAALDGIGGAYNYLAVALSRVAPFATAIADDVARTGSVFNKAIMQASSYSRILGGVGAVVTAGFAGWDRWEQDASDPSLSTGERITRSVIDGAANAGGGALGAWGGGAAGAAIGTAIFPGVGTVIGGAIGAAVGGGLGSAAANGIADWLLG